MPTLYHIPIAICARRRAFVLPRRACCGTRRTSTEKFRSPEYLKLNPAGYVPTLVHDEKVITESRVISEYIDETFDGPALQPVDPYSRSVMRRWTSRSMTHASLHLYLSFVPLFRDRILQLSASEQQKMLLLMR